MSVKRWVDSGGQMLRIKGLRTSMMPKFSDHQVFLGKLSKQALLTLFTNAQNIRLEGGVQKGQKLGDVI